jgi:hypothetical protein
MIVSRRIAVVACAAMLGLTALLCAQSGDSALPPITPTTGTIVFNFTITAASVPTHGVVSCRGSASVNESSSGQNIQQDAHGVATLSNGKWICKATMPYSWMLATPGSDTVFLNYSVETDYGLQVTATNGTSTVVVPFTVDKVNQSLKSISPVPLNGSTTTETITASI